MSILIFTITHDPKTKETILVSNVSPVEAGLTILCQLVSSPIVKNKPEEQDVKKPTAQEVVNE